MPNYLNGKIYMIEPICEYETGDIYIGSTTRPLSERMNQHRANYKSNNVKCKCKASLLFEKYGVENCKIVLIEEYPCDNKISLDRKEGDHQRLIKCINKKISGRTDKEYQNDNADKIKEQRREYYLKNKEIINKNRHQYYLLNKK